MRGSPGVRRALERLPLKPRALAQRVHQLARDSGTVEWTEVSRTQMNECDINSSQALWVLKAGRLVVISSDTEFQEFECVMTKELRGTAGVAALTIVLGPAGIVVESVRLEASL